MKVDLWAICSRLAVLGDEVSGFLFWDSEDAHDFFVDKDAKEIINWFKTAARELNRAGASYAAFAGLLSRKDCRLIR